MGDRTAACAPVGMEENLAEDRRRPFCETTRSPMSSEEHPWDQGLEEVGRQEDHKREVEHHDMVAKEVDPVEEPGDQMGAQYAYPFLVQN